MEIGNWAQWVSAGVSILSLAFAVWSNMKAIRAEAKSAAALLTIRDLKIGIAGISVRSGGNGGGGGQLGGGGGGGGGAGQPGGDGGDFHFHPPTE